MSEPENIGFGLFAAGFVTLLILVAYIFWIEVIVPIAGGSAVVGLMYLAALVMLIGLFLVELEPPHH